MTLTEYSNWLPSRVDPELLDLRARYDKVDSPLNKYGAKWNREFVEYEVVLPDFRGDSVYVWQERWGHAGADPEKTYLEYAEYLMSRDHRGLLGRLVEDGAFGCKTYRHPQIGDVSRDLLDSVNEILFLDREYGLFDASSGLNILDIGAGYGRLAHRMCEAGVPLQQYMCVDAVPESTYLSQGYLKYRQCTDKTSVWRFDEFLQESHQLQIDLAIAIHSFPEMTYEAICGWLDLLVSRNVPALFLIPNNRNEISSFEDNGKRIECMNAFSERGFNLVADEPIVSDPNLHSKFSELRWDEHFMLFRRD
jgi:hypothetical protein